MSDVPPEMQGSKNPLILRNYRYIAPTCWKYLNLARSNTGVSIGPGPTYTDDFQLTFKVDAAPVILTYESELIFRVRCPIQENLFAPQGAQMVWDQYSQPTQVQNGQFSAQGQRMVLAGLLCGYQTRLPVIRTKLKSAGQMIKRAWCSMSNMTFQSVNTPEYLNEILLRKPLEDQRKKPDNYTTEYCMYRRGDDPLCTGTDYPPATQQGGEENRNGELVHLGPNVSDSFGISLGPRGNGWSQWDNVSFSTPYWDDVTKELVIDYRIPLTEILPVFKIGVIPMMMINSATIDLNLDFFHPSKWFISRLVYPPTKAECWLNISTVSFPDINPLAEMLLRPRVYGDRFLVPFLDYFTIQHTYDIQPHQKQDIMFNVLQFFRNVPFVSLSFLDKSTPGWEDTRLTSYGYNLDSPELTVQGNGRFPTSYQFAGRDENGKLTYYKLSAPSVTGIARAVNEAAGRLALNADVLNMIPEAQRGNFGGAIAQFQADEAEPAGLHPVLPVQTLADYAYPLTPEDRARGGFYTLPPNVDVDNVRILLGESAFPLTQQPIDFNSLYMYNRKHFEMYGRNYNVSRVSPLSRARQGDASFFFDLSHGPFSGFTIDSDAPLQVMGTIDNKNDQPIQLQVCLTIWYSNNFNALIASGGVIPTQ